MKNLLLILFIAVFIGCSFEEERDPNAFNPHYLETVPYCFNQLELIDSDTNAIYINPLDFKGKNIVSYLDSTFGDDYCDVITECFLPMDIPNKKLLSFPDMFSLKMELHKTCGVHHCGFKNYMEVLINANHQILFEGEYIHMDEVTGKVPLYYSYADTVLNVKPSRTIMTIQWDKEVNHDTLGLLFMNVVDGYFLAVDNYSMNRFNSKVCELSKSKMDTIKMEFPFRLQFPFYEEVPVPKAIPNQE